MNLQEIKQAIEEGKKVYWSNTSYEVIKGKFDYLITYVPTGNAIGLTWQDGTTLNGNERDFFMDENTAIINKIKDEIIEGLCAENFEDGGLITGDIIEFIENMEIKLCQL